MNKSVKRTAYLKYTFCNIVLVFTVTFDQCWINVLNSFRKKVLHERLWFVPDTKLFNDLRRLYWLFSSAFGPLKSLKASVTVFYQSMKNSSVKILSLLLNPVEEKKSYRICKCNIFFFFFHFTTWNVSLAQYESIPRITSLVPVPHKDQYPLIIFCPIDVTRNFKTDLFRFCALSNKHSGKFGNFLRLNLSWARTSAAHGPAEAWCTSEIVLTKPYE